MVIFAATQGYLDDMPCRRCQRFNAALLVYLKSQYPAIGARPSPRQGSQRRDRQAKLHEAVRAFKADYVGSEPWS